MCPHRSNPRRACAGIVQGTAEVASVRCRPQFSSLDISFPSGAADGVRIGASVAVNGTCLTVGRVAISAPRANECATDVNAERAGRKRRDLDRSVA